jgi:aspartate aminotransferase
MLTDRVRKLKPSPTLALAAKAAQMKADGENVISLTVGEPSWPTLKSARLAGIKAIEEGKTGYVAPAGIPELRAEVAKSTQRETGLDYLAKEALITVGGKFAIFCALQALCEKDSEVIVPAPYWVSYPTMAELAEARPIIVECGKESQFKLTADKLKQAITKRTKAIILNTPNNPTGLAYSKEELVGIGSVLKEHQDIWILSDDIYNRLYFGGFCSSSTFVTKFS